MPRPKGVGMNRPKKMKVVVPSLAEVRLIVRGYVPEPSREPDSERGQPAAEAPPPSPGKLHVSRLERYAFILHKEAEQVRAAYDKAIAKHKIDERVYDANMRSLERRKPSTSLSVLDKRERKLRDLIEQKITFTASSSSWVRVLRMPRPLQRLNASPSSQKKRRSIAFSAF